MNNFSFLRMIPLVLTIGMSMQVNAQNRLSWVNGMGGTAGDVGTAVAVDTAGNVYTAGYFNGKADFDPSPAPADTFFLQAAGGEDIFVSKVDSNGEFLWAKRISGAGAAGDRAQAIAIDAAGNVYTAGYFTGKADFDPSPAPADTFFLSSGALFRNGFISKLDANGNFVWAKSIGVDNGAHSAFSISLDAAGNVYTTGGFVGKVDFNFSPAPADTFFLQTAGNTDIFVCKLDAQGSFVWAKSMGGSGADAGYSLAINPAGGVYITGSFSGTADFDPGPGEMKITAIGTNDVFLAQLDNDGNFVRAKAISGSGAVFPVSTATGIPKLSRDIFGNIIVTGSFKGKVDFDPSPVAADTFYLSSDNGSQDVFIAKYSDTGKFIWAVRTGGTGDDEVNGIALDVSGNIYTTGAFARIVDFDPSATGKYELQSFGSTPSAGNLDIFISKLSPSGAFLWAIQNGCLNADRGNAIAVGQLNREVYTTGFFNAASIADPGNFNSVEDTIWLANKATGSADIFLSKMTQPSCRTSSSHIATACSTYTFNGETYTSSGTYTQIRTNSVGCDSTLVITLTLNENGTNLSQTACDSFTLNHETYKATGIYTQIFTNAAACDSVITLNLTVKYSSDTVIADTACSSYTFNSQTYTTSGVYTQIIPNAAACDSIITLHVTIDTPTQETFSVTACDSFTLNGETYTSSDVYTQALINAAGCDSTLTVDLTIVETPGAEVIKAGTSLTANTADSYQWVDCDNGYAHISGATQRTFTAQENGRYAVVLSMQGACSDTSDCIDITGINGIAVGHYPDGISAFPNPVSGLVYLSSDRTLYHAAVSVRNMTGQLLMHQRGISGKVFSIDLSVYPAGVYLLEMTEGNRTAKIRLLKE